METPEENTASVTNLTRFAVGDLLFTSDGKTMGLIKAIKKEKFVNEYKIDFCLIKGGIPVPHAWKSEWWLETSIQARIISKKWSIQKRIIP